MKTRISVVLALMLAALAAAPANGQQDTLLLTPGFVRGGNHPLRKSGMPNTPRLYISTAGAQLLSDMLTGGRGDGPALRFAAAMGGEIGRDAILNGVQRDEQRQTPEHAGNSGSGYQAGAKPLRRGVVRSNVQWDTTMKIILIREFGKLGTTFDTSTTNCAEPGYRIFCIEVGQFSTVDDSHQHGHFFSSIYGASASSQDQQWQQRQEVGVILSVYDAPTDPQQKPRILPAIATGIGLGSSDGWQHYHSIYANGTSIGSGASQQTYQRVAQVAALLNAIKGLVWEESALEYLAGK